MEKVIKQEEKDYLDFYQKLRKKIKSQMSKHRAKSKEKQTPYERLVEYLMVLPDFFHLSWKLLFDKTVPSENKGVLIAALAYVVSPIDLIPDMIPIAGWVDDLIVITVALNKFFDSNNEKISAAIKKHWAGDIDIFETTKHILDITSAASKWLPKNFMMIVKGMFK
jgi:uncharacterized membrane protein YkvA (DUF1232 family)